MEPATVTATTRAPNIDEHAVQGNLVGFNKDFQAFVFMSFADPANGRAFLADVERDLSSCHEVLAFNRLHKEIHVRRGGATQIVESTWTNLCLTFTGLQALEAPGLDAFPEEFKQGMAARAAALGDIEDSAPATWRPPFGQTIHAMAIVAADNDSDLQAGTQRLQAKMAAHNVTQVGLEPGHTRPDPNRGHEHFGFKDGISQPAIAGLTRSSKQTEPIAAGEFLIGYPDEDGNVSGTGNQPAPQPDTPDYNPQAPAPPAADLPPWAKDGSFVVFRRLRQNVKGFNDFVASEGPSAGLDSERLAAKLVGRWKSGAPLERVPGTSADTDPSAQDPSAADPSVLDDDKVNAFGFEADDADGLLTPRAAHIRKMNPRNAQPPGQEVTNRHRIARRGIPFGEEFVPEEPAYPADPAQVPAEQDRGLLFACYQSSLARGFEFIQTQWSNAPDFPRSGDGHDPIISQNTAERSFNLPPSNPHVAMARWVQTTGGEYFFSPSLPAIRELGASPTPSA
jgi:Dyp-type peroxidase family